MLDLVQTEQRERTKTNALFNGNKLKLGLFGVNCDSGCAMTLVDERHNLSWELTKKIARTADKAGIEVMVPVARWKGLGGPTNFNGRNFETYTWSAGLAAITDHITLTTTSHVQTTHPVFAAKQATTIDHISGGRYCLNVVCGWFHPELEMFGVRSWSMTRGTIMLRNGSVSSSACGLKWKALGTRASISKSTTPSPCPSRSSGRCRR